MDENYMSSMGDLIASTLGDQTLILDEAANTLHDKKWEEWDPEYRRGVSDGLNICATSLAIKVIQVTSDMDIPEVARNIAGNIMMNMAENYLATSDLYQGKMTAEEMSDMIFMDRLADEIDKDMDF